MLLQSPIDPKTWSIVGPAVLAMVLLVIVGVWAAKQLGIVKSDGNKKADIQAGERSRAEWILDITEIVAKENEKLRIRLKESSDNTDDLVEDAERNIIKAIVEKARK